MLTNDNYIFFFIGLIYKCARKNSVISCLGDSNLHLIVVYMERYRCNSVKFWFQNDVRIVEPALWIEPGACGRNIVDDIFLNLCYSLQYSLSRCL